MATQASSFPPSFLTPVVFRSELKSVRHYILEAVDGLFTWGSKRVVILGPACSVPKCEEVSKGPFVIPYVAEISSASALTTALKVTIYSATLIAAIALVVPAQTLAIPATVVVFCDVISVAVVVAFCAKYAFRSALLSAQFLPVNVENIQKLHPDGAPITGREHGITRLDSAPADTCSWRLDTDPSWIFTTTHTKSQKELSSLLTDILETSKHRRSFDLLKGSPAAVTTVNGRNILVQKDPSDGCDLSELYWNLRDSNSLNQAIRQYVRFVVDSSVVPCRIIPLDSSSFGEEQITCLVLTNLVSSNKKEIGFKIASLIEHLYSETQIDFVIEEAEQLENRLSSQDWRWINKVKADQQAKIEEKALSKNQSLRKSQFIT